MKKRIVYNNLVAISSSNFRNITIGVHHECHAFVNLCIYLSKAIFEPCTYRVRKNVFTNKVTIIKC